MTGRRIGPRTLGAAAVILAALSPVLGGAAGPAAVDQAKLDLGRRVFVQLAQPQCGVCHTLAEAGTSGEIGAKLDELQPDEQRVRAAVVQGVGVMPSFKQTLTAEQIEAVAYYVAWAVRAGR